LGATLDQLWDAELAMAPELGSALQSALVLLLEAMVSELTMVSKKGRKSGLLKGPTSEMKSVHGSHLVVKVLEPSSGQLLELKLARSSKLESVL
jgi:hypothetical protein